MTATRTINLLTQTLVAAVVAVALLGSVQALTASASAAASSYSAPTYGSVMLDMGDQD